MNANRLSDETSPYLLQHAHNPVDWHPWGEEALERARAEDKPIFLSIGYSACHWCHVMERESFENDDVAALMNRWFVNVKVDREERPDLDQIYMNAVVALTGHGGWPMSVFLTPDLKPFYGGTYWPPAARMGMPGFADILHRVQQAWESQREHVHTGAEELTKAVAQYGRPQGAPTALTEDLLRNAMQGLLRAFDPQYGGFGRAPKFPHPMDLRLLLRAARRFDSAEALGAVRVTLDRMSRGGIYDQLGGGFHRYSTDARWLAPHFEKMLYDNALLVPAYLEAFQLTGEADYARVARETLDYVLREMTDVEGGFYSTQDADSEGVEGKFFVWSESELDDLLAEHSAAFKYCYDVTGEGNWEGHNILNRPKPHAEAARMLDVPPDELAEALARSRATLFEVRETRIKPARDEKILTSWNGLMISAMSLGARVLNEPRYAHAATSAASFILENMWVDGRLLHSYKDGRARFNAYLDDYACLIDGLAELYQAGFDATWIERALDLAEEMIARFADEESGGFFYTSNDHERLIARYKDSQDNATPSGNAMAATALAKLARLTGNVELLARAESTLSALSGQLQRAPMSGGQALIALELLLGPAHELVLLCDDLSANATALAQINGKFAANAVVVATADSTPEPASPLAELLSGKTARGGQPTLYICRQGACTDPAVGAEEISSALQAAFGGL